MLGCCSLFAMQPLQVIILQFDGCSCVLVSSSAHASRCPPLIVRISVSANFCCSFHCLIILVQSHAYGGSASVLAPIRNTSIVPRPHSLLYLGIAFDGRQIIRWSIPLLRPWVWPRAIEDLALLLELLILSLLSLELVLNVLVTKLNILIMITVAIFIFKAWLANLEVENWFIIYWSCCSI